MNVHFGIYEHRFTQAECCMSLYDRGSYYVADSFEEIVSKGVRGARHMSVGRFLVRDARKKMGITDQDPCLLPWTFLEPEEGDLLERHEAVGMLIETLHAEGISTEPMHVRHSGNKSFWLAIPSGMMGSPIASVRDQKTLRERVFLPFAECPLDTGLWDGRHLHRLLGSEHERGGRVRQWPAWVFMEATMKELFAMKDLWAIPDPLNVSPDPVLLKRTQDKTLFHVPPMSEVPRNMEGTGILRKTEDGVAEGSRNEVAYKRACALLRMHGEMAAYNALLQWNAKNDPPLPEKEIRSCFYSAKRTIKRAA